MTEQQKKLAIIGIIIIAAILLLWPKQAGGKTVATNSDAQPFDVSIPSLNMPDRGNLIINVPGLPSYSPYAFSPISPCMCNGADMYAQNGNNTSGLQMTFVTNQGSSGPNIYNYTAPKSGGDFTGIVWASASG
jgi:hypothetical protein